MILLGHVPKISRIRWCEIGSSSENKCAVVLPSKGARYPYWIRNRGQLLPIES